MATEQKPLFDDRFLEQHTGRHLLQDPVTAIVELIANAWDAGATEVKVKWPLTQNECLTVHDNGEGMTDFEFNRRWMTLSYNRLAEQGNSVAVGGDAARQRRVYGRNGVGRFAPFCFGAAYEVATSKGGVKVRYRVIRGDQHSPIVLRKISEESEPTSGTLVTVEHDGRHAGLQNSIQSEIAMRFLTDPSFRVFLNGETVDFQHIPSKNVEQETVVVPEIGKVLVRLVDTQKTDRTMKQHGIAWHVNGRLVGECTWQGSGHENLIDGRRIEARRYTFFVFADVLSDYESIRKDWSGFEENCPEFKAVYQSVQEHIRDKLLSLSKERRTETASRVRRRNKGHLRLMGLVSRSKWNSFLDKVLEECPSLTERDLEAILGVLTNLELASSRFALIHRLHELEPDQLDKLHDIMSEWSVDMAKVVLDELQLRIALVDEILRKTNDPKTLEVQELQPLFERGLWIFGPEYETIEFTSNQGMTTVIQKLFGVATKGSLNRPDYAIVPDGSVGLYSYPSYDKMGGELGVAKLVLVDLKKPGVRIGDTEKSGCWRWVTELYNEGVLKRDVPVQCFILGTRIDENELEPRIQGAAEILPLHYDTVLKRAKSRLLNLYDKVKDAPFLQEEMHELEMIDNDENFALA
jgi:hypothetical protein